MEKEKVLIEVAGRSYDLKLKTRAIRIIETKLDKGFLSFAMSFQGGVDYKISDIWVLLWACINVENPEMSYDNFLEEIDKSDYTINETLGIARNLIINSLPTEKKKKKGDSNSKN